MGGISLREIPHTFHHLTDHPQLGKTSLYMVQEVILEEAGLNCYSEHGWTVLAHKEQSEWRGTGIAFRATEFTHIDTPTAATASIATTLHTKAGNQIHVLCIHLPHHATLEQTHQLLTTWQDNHPQLQRHPCIIGADWNETFHTTSQAATTARGETILDWLSQHKQYMPQQRDDIPSYHPYNTTMRSRRLDYVSTSRKVLAHAQPVPGSRNLASSDHEAVTATLTTKTASNQVQQKLTHHPMKIKALGAKIPNPSPAAHPWDSLTALAMQVTEPYPKQRFQESGRLKQHRHKLVSGQIPQDQQRQHWKLIQAAHKREKKRWDHAQAIKAATGDWQAYRQSTQKPQQTQWGHKLILNQEWENHMVAHFQSIFKQQPSQQVDAEIRAMRRLLEQRCKETPYKLVQEQEVRDIQAKWRSKKATGPDRVSNEALGFFLSHPDTASKLIWTLDDAIYKGRSPTHDLPDITVLLPKTDHPTQWKDTRPITLSNTIDRTLSQLLLHRCNHILQQQPPVHQFARSGKQASELLVIVRRMARMARDWGFDLWILKIDIRKAFDTIKQTSVAAMVANKLHHTHPWEARAWLSIIHGQQLHVIPAPPASQQPVPIQQTNGVRQGSPDSPILFALKAGQILDNTLQAQQPPPLVQGTPGPPHEGGQFMDDTYLWATDLPRLQHMATDLEKRLRDHGMRIQPEKTQFVQSHPTDTPATLKLGQETIQAKPPHEPISVFNQPVSFQGNESHLAAHLSTKARVAFHRQSHILTSEAPTLAKLKLIATTVATSTLWGCESWPIHHTLLTAANTAQYRVVARAMGLKRRPGETGTDHYQRQIRQARLAIYKNHHIRWSTHILQAIWKLHGHIARQAAATPDNVAQATLQWRNLRWWKAEQSKPRGTRHATRYNPFLDVERYIVHTAGLRWQETAQHRPRWASMQSSFVQAHDVPWSSGKQPSLQNLHQTGPARKQYILRIHDTPPPPRAAAAPHHTHTRTRGKHRRRHKRRQRQKKDRAWQQLLQQLECSNSQ